MHQLPWSRRLLVPIALVALAAASWGAAALAPAPAFGTPAPQPGDTWTYSASNATLREGLLGQTWSIRHVTTTVGGPVRAMDASGRVLDAVDLVEDLDLRDPEHPEDDDAAFPVRRQHAIDDNGKTLVSREDGTWGLGQASGQLTGPNGQELGRQTIGMTRHDWRRVHDIAPLCGHRHSLQDAPRPLGSSILVHGGCEDLEGPDGTLRMQHHGEATWNGRSVQRYMAGATEVQLDASLPVPVRISVGEATFELIGVGVGDAPAAPWASGSLPGLQMKGRPVWGLDDAGIQHPFPLSAAFAAALADDTSRVPAFLAAHPGAQVVEASFRERTVHKDERTDIERTWNVTLSDGRAAHAVGVVQEETQPPRRLPLVLPEAVVAPLRQIRFEALAPSTPDWPASERLPAQMPTVASLMARSSALSGHAPEESNAWGFKLACKESGPDCSVATTVSAGRETVEASHEAQLSVMALAAWWTVEVRRTTMDLEGHILEHREAGMERTELFRLGPLQDGKLPEESWTPTTMAVLPVAGRTLGAVTLAAALGYAVWVLAKLLPGALFTRIESHRVLEHPRRRALQDLVEANPGIHFRDVLRLSGLGAGAARHHLRALVAVGQLTVTQGPRYQCFFPAGQDRRVTAVAGLLKSPVARGIVQSTGADPLSGQQLATRLGVAPGAVSYHVQRLAQAGLVTQRREGRTLLVQATDLGRTAAA